MHRSKARKWSGVLYASFGQKKRKKNISKRGNDNKKKAFLV